MSYPGDSRVIREGWHECTWDKMGDILANAGGRCFSLFDELVSFFSAMNMYSSVKMQVRLQNGFNFNYTK